MPKFKCEFSTVCLPDYWGGRLPHNVQSLAGLLAAYAKAWDAYKEAKQ